MPKGEKSSVYMRNNHPDKYTLNTKPSGPTFIVKKEYRGKDWNVHTNNTPDGIDIKTGEHITKK